MKISTKIWLLPIGVGVAFGLSLALSHRSAVHPEMLRSVDNPYLEHTLRVEGSIEDLRTAFQSAVAEGDPDKLQDARKASGSVREALAGIRRLEGQPRPVAALAAAFDDYEATATAATRALLNHEEVGERVLHMQTAQQTLSKRTSDMLKAAPAALEQRFSSVAEAQQLGQCASALTALLVLVGLADNGEGIETQNLTRVFSHGFTTRPNGHGFGLQGATFILELPVTRATLV